MNNEAIKTKIDEDEEIKRLSTFLQKPNRSMSKELCSIHQCEQLPSKTTQQLPVDGSHIHEVQSSSYCEMTSKAITDNAVPELLECKNHENIGENFILNNIAQPIADMKSNDEFDENVEQYSNSSRPNEINDDENLTPSKFSLEKQLVEIQSQLRELSHLPSTLGNVLDEITKQISEIIPSLKLQDENSTDQTSEILLLSNASNEDFNMGKFGEGPNNMEESININIGFVENSISVENTSECNLLPIIEKKGLLKNKNEDESEHDAQV